MSCGVGRLGFRNRGGNYDVSTPLACYQRRLLFLETCENSRKSASGLSVVELGRLWWRNSTEFAYEWSAERQLAIEDDAVSALHRATLSVWLSFGIEQCANWKRPRANRTQ